MLAELLSPFAQDVAEGLLGDARKSLPSSWLYDEIGSALFEVITLLPEYGLTRADAALLRGAAAEIVAAAGQPATIIELGSGTGTKTRHILQAAAAAAELDYLPIDISGAALQSCVATLREIPGVRIQALEARYLEGIGMARQRHHGRALVLFLGSTIGNFSPDEAIGFLRSVRQRLSPGDCLLLGADLIKPRERLLKAYDDSLGVTAAFNLNLLARINRELDGEFDLRRFAHEARFNERLSRVEMHLLSRVTQKIRIRGLDSTVSFEEGETIFTEASHKFHREDICAIGQRAGWKAVRQWVDNTWGFAETLFSA